MTIHHTRTGAILTGIMSDDDVMALTDRDDAIIDPFIPEPFDAEAEEWAVDNLAAAIQDTDPLPVNWAKVYARQDAARWRVFRSNGALNVGSMVILNNGGSISAVCRYCGKRITAIQCFTHTGAIDTAEQLFVTMVFAHGYSEQSRFLAKDGKISGAYEFDTNAIWRNYAKA